MNHTEGIEKCECEKPVSSVTALFCLVCELPLVAESPHQEQETKWEEALDKEFPVLTSSPSLEEAARGSTNVVNQSLKAFISSVEAQAEKRGYEKGLKEWAEPHPAWAIGFKQGAAEMLKRVREALEKMKFPSEEVGSADMPATHFPTARPAHESNEVFMQAAHNMALDQVVRVLDKLGGDNKESV